MILYFTGTGNSAYVAKRIAEKTGDKTENVFERIKNNDLSEIHSDKPWVAVCPTYAWQIPHIFRDYLLKTPLKGNKKIYFVMTCGDDIGNAEKYASKICTEKGMEFMGCIPVKMPENYLAMFSTPDKDKAAHIIEKSEGRIDDIADMINAQKPYSAKITVQDKLKSSVVNSLFYAIYVKDKKFTVSDECIGCGKCAKLCPCANISYTDKKPVWNGTCTHCMACISVCPVKAIEYGKASVGQPRYRFPEE